MSTSSVFSKTSPHITKWHCYQYLAMGFHPVVKTSPSNAGAAGWIPDWGELRANMSHGKKKKKK